MLKITCQRVDIQPRDLSLLRTLFESRLLTLDHTADLHFDGKYEAAKKRLQKLKAAGLIGERERGVTEPPVLFLTTKGFSLLKDEGILNDYPSFDMPSLEKRSRVSEMTVKHELEVVDVKAAFHRRIRERAEFTIEEFTTWPLLCQFEASKTAFGGKEFLVKPDGFISIHGKDQDETWEQNFFLEVDRSSEVLDTLAHRASCYREYIKSGKYAKWRGALPEEVKQYSFRVLMVFKNEERRNNTAERFLQMNPPVLSLTYLSTLEEVKTDPLGSIWMRPVEYREAIKGTRFDPERERREWGYKRQTEREFLVASKARKIALFADSPIPT